MTRLGISRMQFIVSDSEASWDSVSSHVNIIHLDILVGKTLLLQYNSFLSNGLTVCTRFNFCVCALAKIIKKKKKKKNDQKKKFLSFKFFVLYFVVTSFLVSSVPFLQVSQKVT